MNTLHRYRKRVWTYQWCGRMEVDWVCLKCETIVLDPEKGCQHCRKQSTMKQEKFQAFLARRTP